MSDEPRRSGRATKGQHTQSKDLPDQPAPKPRSHKASSKKKAASTTPEEDDGEYIIRCICGATEDVEGWVMVACDKCETWQHNLCMDYPDELPEDATYYCERCRPDAHKDLLAAVKRGEKPWIQRQKQRRQEEARAKSKKSKKGKGAGARQSAANELAADAGAEQASSPAQTSSDAGVKDASKKRKFTANGKPESTATQSPQPAASPAIEHAPEKRRKSAQPIDKSANNAAPSYNAPSYNAPNNNTPNDNAPDQRRTSSVAVPDKRRDSLPQNSFRSIEELPADGRKSVCVALKKIMADEIGKASADRQYRIPDGETAQSLAERHILRLEHALLWRVGGGAVNENYKTRARTIKFNVPRNPALTDRILAGVLDPEDLATFSSEDFLPEEEQRRIAAEKEKLDKQNILIHEDKGPRIRRTHKGEEIVEDNTMQIHDEPTYSAPPPRPREAEDTPMVDRDGSPAHVELPEDVGGHAPLTVDTSAGAPNRERRDSTFNMGKVWSSVRSPDAEHQRVFRQQQEQRRQSSVGSQMAAHQTPQQTIIDPTIARLLDDDDETYEDSNHVNDWQGTLKMSEPFSVVAAHVAGGDLNNYKRWSELLPQNLEITGRIEPNAADGYLSEFQHSWSSDVAVLSLRAADEVDQAPFDECLKYFQLKARWGVVKVEGADAKVRDLYIIPLPAGTDPIPHFMTLLTEKYSNLNPPRDRDALLISIVAKTRTHQSEDPTPVQANSHQEENQEFRNPPDSTPLTQHGSAGAPASQQPPAGTPVTQPQFSPVAGNNQGFYPPYPPQQGPPHLALLPARALQVLGQYAHCPVLAQMTEMIPNFNEPLLANLRAILEDEPETRTDLNRLYELIRKKNGET